MEFMRLIWTEKAVSKSCVTWQHPMEDGLYFNVVLMCVLISTAVGKITKMVLVI